MKATTKISSTDVHVSDGRLNSPNMVSKPY
jgi:hypothetical protein